MEMRIIKEELTLERVAASGQSEAVVEGSVTLPGGLREAVQVLMVDAVACVKRVEAQQDRAVVSGRAMFHVLYTQGEDRKSVV